MSQCPSMDRNNPMYECPEDDVCAWCGASLPADPKPNTWAFHGCCDAKCAVYQGLSDLGVANGMVPRKGITADYRDLILQAVAELEPPRRTAHRENERE
jgi:hypothetical protein